MIQTLRKIALCAPLAAAAAAHAGGVRLLMPVDYAPGSGVEPKVRDLCRLEERVALDIGAALDGSTASTDGEVVRIRITAVTGGDASWTGPKAISLRVELLKDGQLQRGTELTRTTDGGVFGDYKNACSLLHNDSGRLAKAVAEWVARARAR